MNVLIAADYLQALVLLGTMFGLSAYTTSNRFDSIELPWQG